MSDLTTNALAPNEIAPVEPWNPSGAIITGIIASIVLFLIASIFTLIGAVVLTSFVDVPH